MSKIEQNVMASVAAIYTARLLVSRTALKCYTLVLSLVGTSLFVSVPHVAQNFERIAHGGVGSVAIFILSAIVSTTLIVQLALFLGAIAFTSLIVDLLKSNRPALA